MNEVKRPKKPLIFYYTLVMVALALFNFLLVPWIAEQQIIEVDYGTFITMTENKEIDQVKVEDNQILFEGKDGKVYKTGLMNDPDLVNRLHDSGAQFGGEIVEETSPLLNILLTWVLPVVLFIALGQFMSKKLMDRAGGPNSLMFNGGSSNARVYVQSSDGIKFDDVEGVDEAEESLQEIVDYLHNPDKYREIGASMPKGVLLVGPPGTGKTMLAKAVAGEANVPFFSISGSDFVEMFVGVGAARVRDMFEQARKVAPCLIFIDEIDAVGRSRFSGIGGGHDEREQTLNALLVEMDGLETQEGVILLAATNRVDVLDPALLRPGRFDRQIVIDLPDIRGRRKILDVHAKTVKLEPTVDLDLIAKSTPGFSGADLANLINEAALLAARYDRKAATQQDLEEARDKVCWGRTQKQENPGARAKAHSLA